MIPINDLAAEVLRALVRMITGKLLTDGQIQGLTTSVVGRHFSEWFPEPEAQKTARLRVESARTHISEATRLIEGLKSELNAQAYATHDDLAKQIDEKR